MKRSDSILQKYYKSKLPKYQERPGTVLTYKNNPEWFDNRAVYWSKDLNWNDKVRKAVYSGNYGFNPETGAIVRLNPNQVTKVDPAIQEQSTAEWGRKTQQERLASNTPAGKAARKAAVASSMQEVFKNPITYVPGAVGAALVAGPAAAAGLGSALSAPLTIGSTVYPGITMGNILSAGFASDFLLNRAPRIPGQIARGQYGEAALNTGLGVLDLAGANMISPIRQGASALASGAGRFLTTQTPLRNAWRLNPGAFNLERKIAQENIPVRQIFGDEAYENFLKYGPSTRPGVSEIDQMMDFIKLPKTEVIIGRTGERMEMTGLSNQYEVPYFSQGRLWYQGPSKKYMLEQGPEKIIVPKNTSNLDFYPAGEQDVILDFEKYSPESVNIFAGPRRVLLPAPATKAYDPRNFDVYEGVPHWWKGYQQAKITNRTPAVPEASVKPTLLPEEITAENLPRIVNLGEDVARGEGGYNFGIYPFIEDPNILLKIADPSAFGRVLGESNVFTGLVDKLKDVNDPLIAKIIREYDLTKKGIQLPLYPKLTTWRSGSSNLPISGQVMTRVPGKKISQYSPEEITNIPAEYYQDFLNRLRLLSSKNVGVDQIGDNVLLNIGNTGPQGIGVVDLSVIPAANKGSINVSSLFGLNPSTREIGANAIKQNLYNKVSSGLYDAIGKSGVGAYGDEQIDAMLDIIKKGIFNIKKQGGPIVNSRGFMDGAPPAGSNWRIPGNTLYNPTPYKIRAVGSNGIEKTLKPFDTKRVSFGDAEYVDEYMLQKGGTAKKTRTHYIFAESPNYKPGTDLREAAKDNSFIKEALDMQSYLNKNYPDEKVVIVPGYQWSNNPYREKIKETLKGSTPEDYIYLYGHHGSRYAGIPVKEWGEYFRNAKYANCFLGSCYSDDLVTQQYPRKENSLLSDFDETRVPDFNTAFGRLRNFYYRPAEAWWGVNPNAPKGKDLLEGVTSAMYSTTNVERNPSLEKYVAELQSKLNVASKEVVDKFTSDADYKKLMEKRNQLWGEATNTSDPKIKKKLNDEGYALDKKMNDIIKKYQRETGVTQLTEDIKRGERQIFKSPYILDKLVPNQHYRKHDYNMLFDFERIRPLVQRPPMLLQQSQSFKYGGSLSKYQVGGGGLPLPGGAALRLTTLFRNLFGGNNSSPSQATSNSKITPSLQVKTVKTEDKPPYNFEQTFDKLYDEYNSKFLYERSKNDRQGFFYGADSKLEKRIPLTTGRFKGANVRERILKEAVNAAKQYNVDPWLIISMMGRESTFGEGTKLNKERAGNYQALMSGWTLAEDFQPYDPLRYLADRRAPGIKVEKTPHRWIYNVVDPLALDDYLKKNTNLFEKYADKLKKTPKLGDLNSVQLAARFLKTHKVGDYNPGDPNYTRMVYDDMKVLKSDPEMSKLMKSLGYKMGGNALAMLRDYGGGMSVPPLYKSGGQHGGLDRWFAEKWVDVKTGKPCGRQEGENRAYPACRPSRRVSSETPKTSSELSSAEREKFKRSKTSSERIPYSHKRRK